MTMDNNLLKESDIINQLKHNLVNFSESILNLEGDLTSEEMKAIHLSDSSSKKIDNITFQLGALSGTIAVLQEKLEEANYQVKLEQEYSSKLQGEIGDLKSKVKELEKKEEDLNLKLKDLDDSIFKREADKQKLDNLIKEKEDIIEGQNKQIDTMKENLSNLNKEVSKKEDHIQEQNSQLEQMQGYIEKLSFDITENEEQIESQNQQIQKMNQEVNTLENKISDKELLIKKQKYEILDLDNQIKDLSSLMESKEQLIVEQERKLAELQGKLEQYVEKEKKTMLEFSTEERYIVDKLQEHNKIIDYKTLVTYCEEKFEGVRLICKKLKDKGVIEYEGVLPGFSSEIKLIMIV